jgi:hypothetical protein
MATPAGVSTDLFEAFSAARKRRLDDSALPLAMLSVRLSEDDCCATFCMEHAGCDKEGQALVSEELFMYFGRDEKAVLEGLHAVTGQEWFVSSEAAFQAHCESGMRARSLFGVSFGNQAPQYVVLMWNTESGLSRRVLEHPELPAAVAELQDQGFTCAPDVHWSTKLVKLSVQRQLQAEARAYGRGHRCEQSAGVIKGLKAPTTAPLWMLLTGISYRFVREVQAAFPDATRADWTGLLQWALALPDSNPFAREEKQRICAALTTMFVDTCRGFAELLID